MTLIFRYIIKNETFGEKYIHVYIYIQTERFPVTGNAISQNLYIQMNVNDIINVYVINELWLIFYCIRCIIHIQKIIYIFHFIIIIFLLSSDAKKIVRSHFKTIQFYELKSNGNKIKIHVVLLHVRVKEIESNLE